MGLKDSKSIRLLKEKGWNKLGLYCLNKVANKIKKNSVFIVLNFYPKLTLTKSQYKTFKLANKHFNENYKNIIAISPLFFIKNLKKHITWIESKEFKNVYGNITDLSNIQLNTIQESLKTKILKENNQTENNIKENNLKNNNALKTTMIAPPPIVSISIISMALTKLITSITLIPLIIIPLLTTTPIPLLIKIKQNLYNIKAI